MTIENEISLSVSVVISVTTIYLLLKYRKQNYFGDSLFKNIRQKREANKKQRKSSLICDACGDLITDKQAILGSNHRDIYCNICLPTM